MNVIELKDIVKSYQMGDTIVYALNHVTVNFELTMNWPGPGTGGLDSCSRALTC